MVGTQSERRYPGQGSMWFFVLGDLWIFTSYFACYVHYRSRSPEPFLLGQSLLSQRAGVLNTIILLTSSWLVALGAQATRAGDFKAASRLLELGGAFGVGFMLVKAAEWYAKVRAGLPEPTHEFFLFYFMLTGLHVVHVLLGLGILVLLRRELRGAARPRADLVEAGATYWHMVDALWLLIFALLYLMR